MIDENGNPPLKPSAGKPAWTVSLSAVAGAVLVLGGHFAFEVGSSPRSGPGTVQAPAIMWLGVGLIVLGGLVGIGGWLGPQLRRKLEQKRAWARASERLRAADEAPGDVAEQRGAGDVRVRGVVKVLEAVPAPKTAASCGAWQLGSERECGRFLVVGEGTAGIVDDDCFEVWARKSNDRAIAGGLVRPGTTVEVVGPARAEQVPEALAELQASYRQAPLALRYDGRPQTPVLLVL